jgi:hypothetical protein
MGTHGKENFFFLCDGGEVAILKLRDRGEANFITQVSTA